MDTRTGDLYPSKEDAIAAGVPEEHVAEVSGHPTALEEIQSAIRGVAAAEHAPRREPRRKKHRGRRKTPPKHAFQQRRRRQRMQKASRRGNR